LIHIAPAPFWLGLNPLINHLPRLVSVTARSRCLVTRAPQHRLVALLAENPLWWRFNALQLLEAMWLASQIATDLLIPDSRRRCVAVLLRIAGRRDAGADPVKAVMTQDELAGMANLSRQTIGPILRTLAEDGHITASYRGITIERKNENANRLLRQHLPEGTDLSVFSRAMLSAIARRFNESRRNALLSLQSSSNAVP
jgi:CRP/FNR family transcriptional regulator, cyclic AMP receptor protein